MFRIGKPAKRRPYMPPYSQPPGVGALIFLLIVVIFCIWFLNRMAGR